MGAIRLVAAALLWGLWGCSDPTFSAQPKARRLALLHTADLHSRLFPFRARLSHFDASLGLGRAGSIQELGGAARLGGVLSAELAQPEPPVWLDSGDALEGSEVFHRFGGAAELEVLSALGLSAMALGNHELALDGRALAAVLESSAGFPVLAANLRVAERAFLYGRLARTAVLAVRGLRVGVLGVAHESAPPQIRSTHNPWQVEVSEAAGSVQVAVDELLPSTDLIVVLSHLGLDADKALISGTTGIDVVLGGHQHIVTREPEWVDDCSNHELAQVRGCSPRRVPVVHSGAYGKLVSRLDLWLTGREGLTPGFEVEAARLTHFPLGADTPEDARVLGLLDAYRSAAASPPLGFVPVRLTRVSALGGDTALGNLTADALRRAAGTDVSLVNGSALRTDVEPGILLPSELELSHPFADGISRVRTSGAALKRGLTRALRKAAARGCVSTLQVSGVRLLVRCASCAGEGEGCFEAFLPGLGLGEVSLGDARLLTAALPNYLTQAGADFEELAATGAVPFRLSLAEALSQEITRFRPCPPSLHANCSRALETLSQSRCHEGFGAAACPVGLETAKTHCAGLPCIEGARDDRIQLLP